MKPSVLILTLCLCAFYSISQTDPVEKQQDSAAKSKAVNRAIYGDARKAAIMSAIVPGLGQIYNRKFWKVPVIYAAMGGLGYVFMSNNREYSFYRENLRAESGADPSRTNTTGLSIDQLQSQKLYYKKIRDFAAIGVGLVYLLNIIDANVDAHLKTFDVSDDLSIGLDPYNTLAVGPAGFRYAGGLTIKINFR